MCQVCIYDIKLFAKCRKLCNCGQNFIAGFNIHLPRIQKDHIGDFSKELVKEVGKTAIGDIMAILRQVKKQNQVGMFFH